MYKNVLVPIDLSSEAHIEQGKEMIAVAQKLAESDAKIVLLNVVERVPSYVEAELPKNILANSIEYARKTLEGIKNAAGIDGVVEIRTGRAHTAILEAADEDKVDLIVVASHQPGLQDYFLGSTAARVVRHAKCSVHVFREA